MIKKLLSAISLAALFLVFTSCEKDSNFYDIEDVSKLKMLSFGFWDLEEYTILSDIDAEGLNPLSVYASLPSCELDDIIQFTTDGEMITHEGYTKCAVNNPDSVITYLSLSDKESKIVMWADPENPEGTHIFSGKIFYPSVDEFYWVFKKYNSTTEKTEEHTQYFKHRD